MTGKNGHFEKGVWVEETEAPAAGPDQNAIDRRFSEAAESVISSIDEVMNVTRELVTTEEGKQYIEKAIKDTRAKVRQSLDEIISRVKDEVGKKVNSAKK